MTSRALSYAGLVGKYVRMERPATPEELAIPMHPSTAGMEGLIVSVADTPEGGVDVIADYGMGYIILPEDEAQWTFRIWSSETEALHYGRSSVRPTVRIEYAADEMGEQIVWPTLEEALGAADGGTVWWRAVGVGAWSVLDSEANNVV